MPSNPYLDRIYSILGINSRRLDTYEELMSVDETAGLYDDIYVVQYDFSEIGIDVNLLYRNICMLTFGRP